MASAPEVPGRFDAYAVRSRWGPHVTLQAGTLHLGHHWTTTTRRSVKARALRREGWASVTVARPGGWRIVGGRAHVLDAFRPSGALEAPVAVALAGGAVLRLALGNVDQVLGYAEAARSVPSAFAPWGRALLVVEAGDHLDVAGDRPAGGRGAWARERTGGPPDAGAPAVPGGWGRPATAGEVPPAVAALAGADGACWLGVEADGGVVALPARWDAATGTARVGRDLAAAVGARLDGPLCVTIDDSSSRRPDRKLGVMIRGVGTTVGVDGDWVTVGPTAERFTAWEGFRTATVPAVPARRGGPPRLLPRARA